MDQLLRKTNHEGYLDTHQIVIDKHINLSQLTKEFFVVNAHKDKKIKTLENSRVSVVGSTGIEPVTSTVSR